MIQWFIEIDKKALLYFNSVHSPAWDKVMFWISGDKSWIPLYIILLIIIIYKERPYRFIFTILFVALAVTLSDQISVLIKNLTERPRPSHDPEIADMVHIVNNYRGGAFGFVSSHAANFFAVATFLSNQFKRFRWNVLLFFWAALIAYSRVYLGVHYPLDMICGATLGALIGILCYLLKVRTAVYAEQLIEDRKIRKSVGSK